MKAYVELVQRREREIGCDVLTHQKVRRSSLAHCGTRLTYHTVERRGLHGQPHEDRDRRRLVDCGDGQGCHRIAILEQAVVVFILAADLVFPSFISHVYLYHRCKIPAHVLIALYHWVSDSMPSTEARMAMYAWLIMRSRHTRLQTRTHHPIACLLTNHHVTRDRASCCSRPSPVLYDRGFLPRLLDPISEDTARASLLPRREDCHRRIMHWIGESVKELM